jgi:RNA polymerase sigma-70 factor (ECF subfamily)
VLTFRKQARRERLLFDSELVAALADRAAARADELALRQSALVDCLKKLPGRGQELIRLYYYLGMKIRTEAEKLGRSVAATEKALTRIRRTLYDCVQLAVQREEHG